jgi:hypothetical protein
VSAAHDRLTKVRLRLVPGYGEHHARSAYAELYWLPAVGPTSYLLWRRLVLVLESFPPGHQPEVDVLSHGEDLGVAAGPVRHAFSDRLVKFGIVRHDGEDQYAVNARMPVISSRRLERLSARMQTAHARFVDEA